MPTDAPLLFDQPFDVVIAGGGSAGCVLANRLSADPTLRVLLIEAGNDYAPEAEPDAVRDSYPRSYSDPTFFWPSFVAQVRAGEAPRPFEQARVIGGGSSVMGMAALRGLPSDYDGWAQSGADGWAWQDVLPWFRAVEHDTDFDGPLHGTSGPVSVRRYAPATTPGFCASIADALHVRGFRDLPDLNGTSDDGIGRVPMFNLPERRVSAAFAYLDAAVRARPNLHIVGNALVERVLMHERQARGVIIRMPDGSRRVDARHVIISAGAIHSAALLQRSGIGDPSMLQALGIPVVHALPGVGRNLQNHPLVSIAAWLAPDARQSSTMRACFAAGLRYSSQYQDCPAGDMYMVVLNKTSWHALGSSLGGLGVSVYKPFSHGDVTLESVDARVQPRVRFNLLSDPRDRVRLGQSLRLALQLLDDPGVARHLGGAMLPVNGKVIRDLNRPRLVNAIKARIAATALGASATLRRKAFDSIGIGLDTLTRMSDAELEALAFARAVPTGHVCGTCRIGRATDPLAVVDAQCRVHGVNGLRVIDASVMPAVVSANTNLPVLMIAEKAAADCLADLAAARHAPPVSLTSAHGESCVQ